MNLKAIALEELNKIQSKRRREDAIEIFELVSDIIPDPPYILEKNSIGFGHYHYVNKTNEGDMCIFGITPAKAHITLYFAVQGLSPYEDLLSQLGAYRRGKICLYISNFSKIDKEVFKKLVSNYYNDVEKDEA